MRTPHRLMAIITAVAGVALGSIDTASAQSNTVTQSLSQCSSWSIIGGTFTCTLASSGGGAGGGGAAATAPSGCSVSVSPGSGAPGSAVGVSVSCTAGTAPFTYNWTGGFMQNSTAASGAGNPSANENYFVQVSNSAGSATASGSYTVNATGGGAGNGGGNAGGGVACPAGTQSVTLNATWPSTPGQTVRYLSSSVSSSFGNGIVLVAQFTVPANAKPGFGRITTAEYGGAPTIRTAVLSASPCDFGPQQSPYANSVGVTDTVNFSVGPNLWGYPVLNPGQTYYFNIINRQNGVDTCSAGDCAALIDIKSSS